MKKRKLLYLFPLAALLLSGCSFADIKKSLGDSWVGQNILHPVYDPIKNLINGGDKKEEETPAEETPAEVTITRISLESYPEEVAIGKVIGVDEVSITVLYSDGTSKVEHPETVVCDTSAAGNAELTATYQGKECGATIKVLSEDEVVHVESIRVDKTYVDLHVGETHQIVVTVEPDNATDKSCTFSLDNEELGLGTVSSDGLFTASAVGTAKVTVASKDNAKATKTVTFNIAPVAEGLPESTKANYTKLAASETLKSGEKVNFVGAIEDKYYAMPNYTAGNNIKAKQVQREDSKLVVEDIVEPATETTDEVTYTMEFTVINNGDSTYSFLQADGKYLAATGTGTQNHLKAVDEINDKAKFSVSVDEDGNTQLVASAADRGYLCLNPNSGTPIFSCYGEAKYEKYALYHDGQGSTTNVPVESIAFDQESYSVEQGLTVDVLARVSPATATDSQVIYEIQSADPEGCISLSGRTVTGVEVGNAVIVAKSHENEQIHATVTVEVTEHIERNYGSLESPLSIAEAKALIDLDGGTAKETMYVTGKVSKNDAYSTNYKNTNVWLSDGENEFELYGALMPEGFEPAQPAKNELVGKTAIAHGMGKIYNTTYEFDKNCQIDSLIDVVVPVTGLSLDKNELNMEVGMPDETLVATVAPSDATNKGVTWASNNTEVATVSDKGLVHAVAEGDAVITATSAADPQYTATCSVHVTQPEKQLVSIEVTTMPEVNYTEGDLLDLSSMVVTLHYDDNSSVEITSGWTTNISEDTPLTTNDTSLVVSFGGFSADPITLTITEKPQPVHAGTADDPYTIKDCEIVYANAKLDQGKDIGAEVYVAGTIVAEPAPAIAGGRAKVYISDSSSENTLYIHQANNIGGSNNMTLADVPAGSEIVAKGTLKNYNGAMQMCYVSGVANCEFISIVKPVIAPKTVTITSGGELGVGSNMNLAATVGPEGAAQDVEWSIVSEGEFATLSDDVLTGVAAGEVTVRATAVGYENVYAEKTITISTTGPAAKYATKVTSDSNIVSGAKYYIGYENNGNCFVFTGVDGTSDYESVEVTSNGIEQKESLICVEITEMEGGYSLKVVGGTNNGKYMRGTSGSNSLKFETSAQLNTISISDGLATIISNTSELVFNSTSGQTRFRYYKPATVSGDADHYLRPCIYMLAE